MTQGTRILENFVFNICGCEKDWNPGQRIALVEDQIRQCVGDRNCLLLRERRRRFLPCGFHALPARAGASRCAAFTSIPDSCGKAKPSSSNALSAPRRGGGYHHCEKEFLVPLESASLSSSAM